jgi:hypothetical protein
MPLSLTDPFNDLPDSGWIEAYWLRPDILDHEKHQVTEIKPSDTISIALGRAKVGTYIGVLALRYPGTVYTPGTWNPEANPYTVNWFPGISGITLQCTAKNVGGGVVAYETNPSSEELATEIAIAYELSVAIAGKALEGAEVVGDVEEGALEAEMGAF